MGARRDSTSQGTGGASRFAGVLAAKMRRREPSRRPPDEGTDGGGAPRFFGAPGLVTAREAKAPLRPRAEAVEGARRGDRVLMGRGLEGAEARVRIGEGALAGAEV